MLKKTFKIAFLCVGCDIPATRKLCGFLGHSACLGCSKCSKIFSGDFGKRDYSGFDVNSWPKRTLENYMSSIRELKKAKTQTERDRLESSLGVRFSKLFEIDSFDPV